MIFLIIIFKFLAGVAEHFLSDTFKLKIISYVSLVLKYDI